MRSQAPGANYECQLRMTGKGGGSPFHPFAIGDGPVPPFHPFAIGGRTNPRLRFGLVMPRTGHRAAARGMIFDNSVKQLGGSPLRKAMRANGAASGCAAL